MITAIFLSLGVIFIAELGDKSQLMALSFALRFRWQVVLAGIVVATMMVFAVSVTVGHYVGAALPAGAVKIASGILFLLVGLWSLREEPDHAGASARAGASAFVTVTSAFLFGELGDKTMFAAISLAANHNSIGVWIGSTFAMVAADGLALVVGLVARRHLPEHRIRVAAAYGFLAVGAWTLLTATAPTLPEIAAIALSASVLAVIAAVHWGYLVSRPAPSHKERPSDESSATVAPPTPPGR
jgi:putative Ca2+/H+ antiporter (TMEM165/GDT1 family)